jgi:hypothetical protein
VVTDLAKLSKAIADATPEKAVERKLQEKVQEIQEALRQNGVYDDPTLGIRISGTMPARLVLADSTDCAGLSYKQPKPPD